MGLGKMMDFTLMFIVTITSAYPDTSVNNLTAILSSPDVPLFSFLGLLQKGKVIEILQTQANSQTGLTLLAPNNAAIYGDKVPWGTLSAAQLQSLLLFHALPQYFGDTLSDMYTLSQLSPVTTMAGGQYTLNITYGVGLSVNDSGSSSAQMLGAADDLTTYPTQVYQIDKVLMPEAIFGTNIPPPPFTSASEAIFGTNIPPPPSTSASSAPSASTTSTPHKNKSGNSLPLKSRTGLSGGVIAGISTGVVVGALLVAACIKCGHYFYGKPGELSSSKRDVQLHPETGREGESQLPNQPQEGGVSTGDVKIGNITINLGNPNTGGGLAVGNTD